MNILGIDQASHCGWCCGNDLYGEWDISTRSDESAGMKMLRFKAKLRETLEGQRIELVAYERVAGQHKNAIIHASKMVAIIETLCEELGINYVAFSAGEIKKFATGNGAAKKADMVKAAQEQHGYVGDNDNICDAIFIYHYAKKLYS